jgi:membrane-associated phospholipid phosphatase
LTRPGDRHSPWFWPAICLGLAGLFLLLLWLDPVIESYFHSLRQTPQGYDVVFWRNLMDGSKYLGRGLTQFLFAVVIFGLGLWLGYQPLKRLGLCAATTVALSGLANTILKFAVGRPRPRMHYFAHTLGYQWETFSSLFNMRAAKATHLPLMGPSFLADFSSFPSGHAMTSFALAVVLARVMPRQRVLFYGLAAYISVFRVVGSSHFASDVLAGAVLGMAIGWLLAGPVFHLSRD